MRNNRWYPLYHVAAPIGWINDPNGFCMYQGEYHLFYQYHPHSAEWGPMHWGHVFTKDLVHWEHLPIALTPSEPYERNGCFSGSGIEKDNKLFLLYTGHIGFPADPSLETIQTQCLAYSDDGIKFEKYIGNPIISPPKSDEIHGGDFRDPKVWEHDGKYYCVIGSKTPDSTHGQIILYESDDLINWKFINISTRAKDNEGTMWECPNFAEVDGKDVLVLSPIGIAPEGNKYLNAMDSGYFIGTLDYETGKYKRGKFEMIDYGFDFYAPQVMQTEDGRCIMIGWMDMWQTDMPEKADGWAGIMSVPRELKIKKRKLFTEPIKELETLRESEVTHKKLTITEPTKLDGVKGITGELLVEVDTKNSANFTIEVRVGEGEKTFLTYEKETAIFGIDRAESGAGPKDRREVELTPASKLNLRIYLDRSSVEVFINEGEYVLSARIYPREDSQDIVFVPRDGDLILKEVTFYTLGEGITQ